MSLCSLLQQIFSYLHSPGSWRGYFEPAFSKHRPTLSQHNTKCCLNANNISFLRKSFSHPPWNYLKNSVLTSCESGVKSVYFNNKIIIAFWSFLFNSFHLHLGAKYKGALLAEYEVLKIISITNKKHECEHRWLQSQ